MTTFKNITDIDYRLLKEKYNEEELDNVIDKIEKEDYPVQYAIGNVPFLNTTILVDERVLIPRFATELLVQKLIQYIKSEDFSNKRILDLCSGSGAISIALKKNLVDYEVKGIDISKEAVGVSLKNASLNQVEVEYVVSDVLTGLDLKEKYSVIVANPPYVKLDEEVSNNTKYEPRGALYPGEDDLIFYKKILTMSKSIISNRALIAFEIGATQGEEIIEYAKKIYPEAVIKLEKDYENFDRFIFIFINE